MNLLDVGCGGGVFLKLARELGANVQGVEPSPHGAATARRAGIPVFNGTLDAFLAENREARFDLITANHVVEHHPDPVALLTQMRAALSTGGKIWFSVPNAGSSGALSLRWRWHSCDLPYHLMQFTPKSVREAAKKADLEIKDLRTLSYAEHVLHSMLHTWRRRWKIPVRLMQRLPILPFARRRAHTMDSECTGEAILCELAL
jgi:2-polyprenyl-3-methyl-5-hydroxy-6-metoxy-1,4-benzoquinol methylase